MINLDFSGDYTQKFSDVIDYLFDKKLVDSSGEYVSHDVRTDLSESVIEAYVHQTGERPKSEQLDRLGFYILKEDKKKRKGMVVPEMPEYPFLSERQMRSRYERERDWSYTHTIDTNGVNTLLPTRSNRISNEMARGDVKLSDKT